MTFPGEAPFGRELVLAQAVRVYERHWIQRVPAKAWPQGLRDCPHDCNGRLELTRQAVLEVGAGAVENRTPLAFEQLLVAAAAWGAGTKWRSVVRAQRPWIDKLATAPTEVGHLLANAASVLLDGDGATEAYQTLLEGRGHISGLGPAFFTKFLYFAGFDRSKSERRPLILDRYVARGLNDVRCTNWGDTAWSSLQYGEYLDWAKNQAQGSGPITSEDEAEYRIWYHGKSL
ncbi:MAG: hypothetical protein ABSB99_11080 [Acidimicrobiales bacterium]